METQSENSHYFLDESARQPYRDDGHLMFESVGSSFSYGHRAVIGLVLALAIGALGYMAWRGSRNGADATQASSQAPPVADQPAHAATAAAKSDSAAKVPAPSAARTATANSDSAPAGPKNEEAAAAPAAKAATPEPVTRASEKSETAPAAHKTASRSFARSSRQKAPSEQPTVSGGGEELAIAQRYLNAGPGQKRDPAQAALWLWKSVAKQNPQATILLADLYLRGDGIQKNCDQARVLLDAAARKGQTGAGQRLRNMQTFGCQ